MSILDRWRKRSLPAQPLRGESVRLSGTVPGPDGRHFMRVTLEMDQTPGADGEDTELRMHVSADFSALTALPAPRSSDTRALALVGHWLARRVASARVQRLLAPLADKTFNSWVQMRASTAPLDGDSRELLPAGVRRLGFHVPDDGVPLHAWSHQTAVGAAQLTTLNIDARQLPPMLRRLLGQRFKLGGTIVNVVEPKPAPK